jgi:hypothetical protein
MITSASVGDLTRELHIVQGFALWPHAGDPDGNPSASTSRARAHPPHPNCSRTCR